MNIYFCPEFRDFRLAQRKLGCTESVHVKASPQKTEVGGKSRIQPEFVPIPTVPLVWEAYFFWPQTKGKAQIKQRHQERYISKEIPHSQQTHLQMMDVSLPGYFWYLRRTVDCVLITSSKPLHMMKANCYWRYTHFSLKIQPFFSLPCFWEVFFRVVVFQNLVPGSTPCLRKPTPLRSSWSWRLYDVAEFQRLIGALGTNLRDPGPQCHVYPKPMVNSPLIRILIKPYFLGGT